MKKKIVYFMNLNLFLTVISLTGCKSSPEIKYIDRVVEVPKKIPFDCGPHRQYPPYIYRPFEFKVNGQLNTLTAEEIKKLYDNMLELQRAATQLKAQNQFYRDCVDYQKSIY